MKATWLTVSELAAALKLSVVSVRRAYWKGDIPVERIGRVVRFDLEKVKDAMRRNGEGHSRRVGTAGERRATGGASRRRAAHQRPRLVKRGRNFQQSSRRRS
jgi:excisionase family DNA binding protein